jgi:excisionase family DNA binding protein
MTVIAEIDAAGVPADQLAALESFASTLDESALRDLLFGLTISVKNGTDVALLESETELTPAQAASRLKMSRTHLYKLLDRGEIVSHQVGRDRRILLTDLVQFEAARQRARRELAERFARTAQTRSAAIDELIEGL